MKNKILIMFIIMIALITGILIVLPINRKDKFYLSKESYGKGEFTSINNEEIENILNNDGSIVIYTYNNYCSLPVSCEEVFKSYEKKYNISFYSISFENFKNTSLYKTVKYAPSVIIVRDGNIVDYLDASDDEDLQKYQNELKFERWINNYIYTK